MRFHPAPFPLRVLGAVGCFRFTVASWVPSTTKHQRVLQLSTKGTAWPPFAVLVPDLGPCSELLWAAWYMTVIGGVICQPGVI